MEIKVGDELGLDYPLLDVACFVQTQLRRRQTYGSRQRSLDMLLGESPELP